MIDAKAVIAGFIGQQEGGLSLQPADDGNWYSAARYQARQPQARGMGELVGSNHGVTAYALIRYRVRNGWALGQAVGVSRADIAAITLPRAVDIGLELYYREPAIDGLLWNRVTASVLDKAWGSGPDRAIRMLQHLIGATVDGCLGPATAEVYKCWIGAHGEEGAAHLWCAARIAFDQSLAPSPNDPDARFVGGWNNRSRSFLPGTSWWRAAA